jgi:hypothetical protein
MPPAICPQCCPHLATLSEYAAASLKDIMNFAEEMKSRTDAMPDDLKPFGEALTKISMEVLTESYVDLLNHFLELKFQEFTRAAISANHQTKPDSLKRSNSDAI